MIYRFNKRQDTTIGANMGVFAFQLILAAGILTSAFFGRKIRNVVVGIAVVESFVMIFMPWILIVQLLTIGGCWQITEKMYERLDRLPCFVKWMVCFAVWFCIFLWLFGSIAASVYCMTILLLTSFSVSRFIKFAGRFYPFYSDFVNFLYAWAVILLSFLLLILSINIAEITKFCTVFILTRNIHVFSSLSFELADRFHILCRTPFGFISYTFGEMFAFLVRLGRENWLLKLLIEQF